MARPLHNDLWARVRMPLVYALLILIAFLPLYTERPYDARDTQKVIFEILMVATRPYAAWGWIFHLGTLVAVGLALWNPALGGRAIAAYFGLNYLVVAALQTRGQTPSYGFAVHTGALVAASLLGLLWLWVAWRGALRVNFQQAPRWRWLLLPFALLVFWSPIAFDGSRVVFDFNPRLLLTSPDYGLAYCFMTPVLLFLIVLAWPQVDGFALRVTAFNALLYGLFNLANWFDPNTVVVGVMHLPLLVMAVMALLLPRLSVRPKARPYVCT